MRHQELCFSAFVLGAAIASDNCRHSRNMRPEPPIFQCETLAWLFLICDMPLPVAGEIDALTALHCQRGHAAHLIAIRDAAVMEARGRAEMPVMQEGPLRAAGAYDQADRDAGDHALSVGSSGRGSVSGPAYPAFLSGGDHGVR
jgi:hypothetical protein